LWSWRVVVAVVVAVVAARSTKYYLSECHLLPDGVPACCLLPVPGYLVAGGRWPPVPVAEGMATVVTSLVEGMTTVEKLAGWPPRKHHGAAILSA
jgi:hypothetical protein